MKEATIIIAGVIIGLAFCAISYLAGAGVYELMH
jgi:hypothetical protein